MKLTLSDFPSFSFHDSPVRQISESEDRIIIALDFAYIRPPIEEAGGKLWKLSNCSLVCRAVQKNEKEEWTDTVEAREHTTPERPIEEVQHEEVLDGCLALSGFTQNNNWGVWRIQAEDFDLAYQERTEIKEG